MAVVASAAPGVPASAPHELTRERLLEPLHRQRTRPLILLVAPAGFGKSTLAATYVRESGAAAVWLTLLPADRDSRRLFIRLTETFEAALEEPLAATRQALETEAEGVGLARALLADLAQVSVRFILVLDDFHLVDGSTAVTEAVDTLVRGLPEAGQVVITAREPPDLSMTRLLASGAVFALGAEDLRFTDDETAALRAELGGDASQDGLAEGWVAGILLGGAPRQLGLRGGSLLGTYVEKEVLGRLSSDEQTWLEVMSVLDTVTPTAAERLFGPAAWPPRLRGLAEHCPFLVTGHDGSSYRLHGLVRESLLNRLRRSDSELATHAWTVARELAEEAGDAAALVLACQELGQPAGAVDLVRRSTLDAMRTGRWPAALVTLELLPAQIRRAQPDLSLFEARALLNLGRLKDAREAADNALVQAGRSDDAYAQVWAASELAAIGVAMGDVAEAEDWISAADHLVRSPELRSEQRRLLEGRTLGVRAMCDAMRGRNSEARENFGAAERLLSPSAYSVDLALVQLNYGSFCVRIGDYETGQAQLSAAASHWRLVGDRGRLATTQTNLGELQLRLGEVQAAGETLSSAHTAAQQVGATRLEPWIMLALGMWHRASGRIQNAVQSLDEALRLAEETADREVLVLALVGRAELALVQAKSKQANSLLEAAHTNAQILGSEAVLAAVDRARGRMCLAEGAGGRALTYLEEAERRAAAAGGPDEHAETLYWLGTAYLELHRSRDAQRSLEQALDLVQKANRPPMLAGAVADDQRLLKLGRELSLKLALLEKIERAAAPRRPWTGVKSEPELVLVASNEVPRLDLTLFGSFVIHRNGEVVASRARKIDPARQLLALLVLNPNGLPDEQIAEQMWPEMTPERALHNLQAAAWALRRDLGNRATVRLYAKTYQLSPQMVIESDVKTFNEALARGRGATGDALIQTLTHVVDEYKGALLADVGWHWVEPERADYRSRFVGAAMKLADLLAHSDPARSDGLAERVIDVAPETDTAYERLIQNARTRGDPDGMAVRRLRVRYQEAASRFGFHANPRLLNVASGGR